MLNSVTLEQSPFGRGSGAVFAVGKARVLETLLLSPLELKAAFNAGDFHGAESVIKSRSFGRLIDNGKEDFGIGKYIAETSALFSEISQKSGDFFTSDESGFLRFLEENSRSEILSALDSYPAPLDFYGFLDDKRKSLMGRIEGDDVLEYIWLALWWQARIVRMILMAKNRDADFKYVS
ncbi:hypothetical protein KKF70_04510 [bacterium]|nr:hypothetical protein [bacterium]